MLVLSMMLVSSWILMNSFYLLYCLVGVVLLVMGVLIQAQALSLILILIMGLIYLSGMIVMLMYVVAVVPSASMPSFGGLRCKFLVGMSVGLGFVPRIESKGVDLSTLCQDLFSFEMSGWILVILIVILVGLGMPMAALGVTGGPLRSV